MSETSSHTAVDTFARVKRATGDHCVAQDEATGLRLLSVTEERARDEQLIGTLSRWRVRHQAVYPTQFPVTAEGTRSWLRDRIIGAEGRMMFLLTGPDDAEPLGHLGFDHVRAEDGTAALSNIVAGRPGCLPSGMGRYVELMMAWGYRETGLSGVWATPFGDNRRAVGMLERVGFATERTIPLRRHVDGRRVAFRPLVPGDTSPPDRVWLYMTHQP